MNESDYKKTLTDTAQEISSQQILESYGIVEYTVDDIIKDFENAIAYKQEQARIFKILDAADHSDIWKVFNRKIPNYVQTPTHNPITVIKEATKASIMPTSYSGTYRPLSMEAKQIADTANKYFHLKWNTANMDDVNSDVADYAYLHGTSGVLFGWNNDIVDETDYVNTFSFSKKSQLQVKAYHPSNIFPDPGAVSVEEMQYLFFSERKSKAFLMSIPRFTNAMLNIVNSNDSLGNQDPNYILDKSKQSAQEIVTFLTCYKRVFRKGVDPITGLEVIRPSVDVIYMAGRNILDVSKDIQPNCIPFIPLYDEPIPNNFWGISKCYKVLSLVLALNQLDSTEATAYYKNQNPTEFINAASGINIPEYQKKRDNPDVAFVTNCEPERTQAYSKRPELPRDLDTYRQYLISAIQQVSGVDSAYLGRSYGSIQTTGGVQQAIDRSTMRDNNRLKNIDKFIRQELELLTKFFIIHGQKEKFFVESQGHETGDVPGQELEFDPAALATRGDIVIEVSNAAPKSNSNYEETVMKLMELQLKYNPAQHGYPDFITPEEMLQWLNIPQAQKSLLLERMTNQMTNMKLEEYMAVLTAVGTLTQGGMTPEQALMEVAKQMQASVLGQIPAASPAPEQVTPK